ncbi:response regulator [Pedobacter sp. MC2016-14]|uniref:response regulator n=1 Tax=Pedobacter sp. MC2016-14 TaxID=2897327 RepID=UPI001E2B3379|nr:response regulator [Pedobacter sp. MC2016-14]MCD0490235.1 response regulator [Pedobacter sp. MC2016-14]
MKADKSEDIQPIIKYKGLNCVLLIDDDVPTNFIHRKILSTSNIDVDVKSITSAREALEFLTSSGKYENIEMDAPRPGLIFLDINMPGMSGWDFMQEYGTLDQRQKEEIKVIMLTTSTNPDDEALAMQNKEIVTFMHKPLTRQIFNKIASEYFEVLT